MFFRASFFYDQDCVSTNIAGVRGCYTILTTNVDILILDADVMMNDIIK